MAVKTKAEPMSPPTLRGEFASDLMRPNPVSIRHDATVQEATALLTDKGFSAAPVIDRAGRPVGVVSRFDVLVHDREKLEYVPAGPNFYEAEELAHAQEKLGRNGFEVVNVDRTRVKDIMTPIVFSVSPETPARNVIKEMLKLRVHRLFVVGPDGVLVGVISATDILQHLE